MQRYFATKEINNTFILSEQDQIHVKKVMRMKIKDQIICIDDKQINFLCEINSLNPLIIKEVSIIENNTENKRKITLLLAVIKPHNFEFAVQKSVELGINRIVPIICERSQKIALKESRLALIAKEAAEQSKRNIIPLIEKSIGFDQLLKYRSNVNIYGAMKKEESSNLTNAIKKSESCTILIGPEGGLSNKEIDFLKNNHFLAMNFTKTILRSETAAIYALSAINMLNEED